MPEEAVGEDIVAPRRSEGISAAPIVVGAVVVLLVAGVFLAVLLLGRARRDRYIEGAGEQVRPAEWLDIPALEVKDIPLSVRLTPSGAQRKQLTVGVVVRFAPPPGEEADVKRLQKEFIPRVTSLSNEFRHIVIEQMNSKDYAGLNSAEQKNQLLKTFRREFRQKLKAYGLDKMAQVHEVMWADFFWN
jgi:hypothetical protein